MKQSDNITNLSLEDSNIAVFFSDVTGTKSKVNNYWSKLTGLTATHSGVEHWQNALHPDDKDMVLKGWQEAVKKQIPFQTKHRYKHPNGETIWVMSQCFPKKDTNGKLLGFIGTMTRIMHCEGDDNKVIDKNTLLEQYVLQSAKLLESTNIQLEAEKEKEIILSKELDGTKIMWETIATHISDIIMIINKDGIIKYINHSNVNIPADKQVNTLCYNYLENDQKNKMATAIQYAFDTNQPVSIEIIAPGKSTKKTYYSVNITPINNPKKIEREAVIVSRDVTLEKNFERRQSEHRNEQTNSSKLNALLELTSGIAHELNQPLAAINNYATGSIRRLQAKNLTADEQITILKKVASQAQRCGNLILKMRNLFKRNKTLFKKEDINNIISATIKYIITEEMRINSLIKLQLEPNLPLIEVEKIQIEQVIINLIKNSIEACSHIPNETATIKVSSSYANNKIKITVEDNGVGIPVNDLDKVFTPFYTLKHSGMGMGLSICQSIIDAHSGKITAENVPDGGTIFTITLPVN